MLAGRGLCQEMYCDASRKGIMLTRCIVMLAGRGLCHEIYCDASRKAIKDLNSKIKGTYVESC